MHLIIPQLAIRDHLPQAIRNAHAHVTHPVCARGQVNQLAKKLVTSFAVLSKDL